MTHPQYELIQAVQHNCHIADARHAGDATLCIYLLKMREFYRWEHGLSLTATLDNQAVGAWLSEREALWDRLETQDYAPLPVAGPTYYDPFAHEALQAALRETGLVYSAGYGRRCRPLFFLAELEQVIEQDDYTLLIAGRELARDVEAPPAMNQGQFIYIRRESLRRMLWEKVDEWRWSGLDNPIGRALAYYPIETDLESALDALTATEMATVIAHEIGEVKAGQLLGDAAWQALLFAFPATQAELLLRAVRDNLADALVTLPDLIAQDQAAALHFYFGQLSALRKQLLPSWIEAYQHWHQSGDSTALTACAEAGSHHWTHIGQTALALFQSKGPAALSEIEALVRGA